MNLMLDAWLERSDPKLRVFDTRSGEVLWQWNSDAVHALLASGRIDAADLSRLPSSLPNLLRELLTPVTLKETNHG